MRALSSRALVAASLAAAQLLDGCCACDFLFDLDHSVEYFGLNPDWTVYNMWDCEAACCADQYCDVWQYSDMPPVGMANCMHGVAGQFGDSNGVYWTGAQGRADGPGEPGDHPPPPGSKRRHGASGDTDIDVDLVLILAACGVVVYLGAGTYYGRTRGLSGLNAVPNITFWRNLGGLVRDGFAYTLHGTKGGRYQPVDRAMTTVTGISYGSTAALLPQTPIPIPAAVGSGAAAPGRRQRAGKPKRTKMVKKKTKKKVLRIEGAPAGGGAGGSGASSLE